MELINIVGKIFNRLTVLSYMGSSKWLCLCECGNKTIVDGAKLKNGHTKSCGCLQKEQTSSANSKHKLCGTRIHTMWHNMKSRCNNKHNKEFHNYGGRGISVCNEWNNSLNGFDNFYKWAMENGYSDTLTIERIDTNGNYDYSNCKFATFKEQANNTRRTRKIEFCGVTLSIKQWSELFNINYGTFKDRILKRKWNFYKCLGFATREEAEAKLKEIKENE